VKKQDYCPSWNNRLFLLSCLSGSAWYFYGPGKYQRRAVYHSPKKETPLNYRTIGLVLGIIVQKFSNSGMYEPSQLLVLMNQIKNMKQGEISVYMAFGRKENAASQSA
jgi:hypothetical protein